MSYRPLLVLVAGLVAFPAYAQQGDPLPVQPNIREMLLRGHKFTLGESCAMMSKSQPGVIKRDGCRRWYCGRKEFQDIVEFRPNFASEMGCVWRVVGERCFCQRASGEIVPPQIPK